MILKLVIGLRNFLDVAAVAVVGQLEPMQRFIVVLLQVSNGVVQILQIGLREKVRNIIFALRGKLLLRIFTTVHKIHHYPFNF